MKDAILVWFTTALKRLFKVVQAQKGFKSNKVQGLQLQEIWRKPSRAQYLINLLKNCFNKG